MSPWRGQGALIVMSCESALKKKKSQAFTKEQLVAQETVNSSGTHVQELQFIMITVKSKRSAERILKRGL